MKDLILFILFILFISVFISSKPLKWCFDGVCHEFKVERN